LPTDSHRILLELQQLPPRPPAEEERRERINAGFMMVLYPLILSIRATTNLLVLL
jgi:hypothetical protein